ncbi:MAG: DegV family protein [Cellulosilyticaceae bacterium]
MTKIALITDSSCDLTFNDLEKHDIIQFPIRIIYKDREYLDKVEISSEQMYAQLSEEVPSTSLPDMHYCENILKDLIDQGYTDAIVVNVSTALSGTQNSIRLLAEQFPELNFHFFDTKTLGYPQGVIAMEASKLIKKDLSCTQILAQLEEVRQNVKGFIAIETLEYLIKGGRIGKVAGTVGELLHIRPIISSNDEGILYSYTKARGKKQVFTKLRNTLMEFLDASPCRVWILQGDAKAEAESFLESIKDHPNLTEISLETVGAAMGIHTGPGVVGFAILTK